MRRRRRRANLGTAPSGPMFVLAGLPPALHNWALELIQNARPRGTVVGAPAPVKDGALYSTALVNVLVDSLTGFAMRRRTRGPAKPVTPKSITLLYVPAND